nr:hypothetical protein [Pseudomonas benzenivorans]
MKTTGKDRCIVHNSINSRTPRSHPCALPPGAALPPASGSCTRAHADAAKLISYKKPFFCIGIGLAWHPGRFNQRKWRPGQDRPAADRTNQVIVFINFYSSARQPTSASSSAAASQNNLLALFAQQQKHYLLFLYTNA